MSADNQRAVVSTSEDSSSDLSMELIVDKQNNEERLEEKAIDANVYDFDIDTIKDKPWLKPGADLNDYFNFGFTEKSWKKYCEMQKENRDFADREAKTEKKHNEMKNEQRNYRSDKYENTVQEKSNTRNNERRQHDEYDEERRYNSKQLYREKRYNDERQESRRYKDERYHKKRRYEDSYYNERKY